MGRRTAWIPAKMWYVSSLPLPPPFATLCQVRLTHPAAIRKKAGPSFPFILVLLRPARLGTYLVKVIRVPHQAKCQTES
ncbi:hypothetical protein CGRA01v4_04113 [Colletotrichum graminicola]|nr:hypothetical protein CGRA01v4_04113 [Colletotrichum graminicola]